MVVSERATGSGEKKNVYTVGKELRVSSISTRLLIMALLDNKLVHVALVVLALYVIVQIMNKDGASEHLDSAITPEGQAAPRVNVVPVTSATAAAPPQISVPAITTGSPAPALQATSIDGLNGAGTPVMNISGTALTTTASSPSPVASTEETLLAAAPVSLPGDSVSDFSTRVEAVDPDFLFGRRTALEPSELIPKTPDAELYAGMQPDSKFNQNFLQNRWSSGIDVSVPKRTFINDLRGVPAPPALSIVSPWSNPTHSIDLYRKSLAEIS